MTRYVADINKYRTLGVEIECVVADSYDLATNMRRVNIEADVEGYNHRTRDYWKVITDSSLSPSRRGGRSVEVVSPILNIREGGWDELKLVMRAIRETDGYVNRSCGLHVHWGARDFTGQQIRNLLSFYTKFEQVLDSLVSPSRRSHNSYCNSMDVDSNQTGAIHWIDELDRTGRRNSEDVASSYSYRFGRFKKVNLESLERYGTIEFRHHQGTLSYTKARRWAELMNLIMTKAHFKVRNVKTSKQTIGEFIRALRIADHHLENGIYRPSEANELRRLREWIKRRAAHFEMGLDRELTEDHNGVNHDSSAPRDALPTEEEDEPESDDPYYDDGSGIDPIYDDDDPGW